MGTGKDWGTGTAWVAFAAGGAHVPLSAETREREASTNADAEILIFIVSGEKKGGWGLSEGRVETMRKEGGSWEPPMVGCFISMDSHAATICRSRGRERFQFKAPARSDAEGGGCCQRAAAVRSSLFRTAQVPPPQP